MLAFSQDYLFRANPVPNTDYGFDLGRFDKRWDSLFVRIGKFSGNVAIDGTLSIDSIITALRLTSNLTVDGTVTGDTLVGDWTMTGNLQSTAQGSLAGVASAKFYYQPSTGNAVLGAWGKDASTTGTISFYLAKSDGSGGEIEVSIDSASTNFTGNVLPSAASTYALGSAVLPWRASHYDSLLSTYLNGRVIRMGSALSDTTKFLLNSDTTSLVAMQWELDGKTPMTRMLTVAANAPLASSAGAQDLSADRTWTLSADTTTALSGLTTLYQNSLKASISSLGSAAYVDSTRIAYQDKTNTFTQAQTFNSTINLQTISSAASFTGTVATVGDVTVGGIALLDTIRNSLTSVVVDDSLTVTGLATIAGDVAVNGGDLTTTQTTFNLLNTNVTTINIGGVATTITTGKTADSSTLHTFLGRIEGYGKNLHKLRTSIGEVDGELVGQVFDVERYDPDSLNNTAGFGGYIRMNVGNNNGNREIAAFKWTNTRATGTGAANGRFEIEMNKAGVHSSSFIIDSTFVTFGSVSGTGSIPIYAGNGNFADVIVNGGDITSDDATFALLNVTPTTINAFGAATTISMGALTGTTTINNDLIVGDELIVNGTGTSSFAGPISGTTVTASSYGIFGGGDIVVASGGMAKIIIDGADATETNAENAIFEKTANLNYTSRASHIFVIDNDANESNRTFSIRADSVESSDIFTLSKAGALTVAAGLSGTTVTMTGSLDVDGDVADTSAFTTTATRAAVYIAGALSTDKYTVSHRNASGTETLPVADDQMSYYAKADSLIVLRQAGTTSGLKFSYSRFK